VIYKIPRIVITNPPIEVREEVNKRSKEKEELEKKLEEIRLKIRRKESTVIDFEIIKKGFEGFYKVYPSLEPKERQALWTNPRKRDK